MKFCVKKECSKLALSGYEYCEIHVGAYLKDKQDKQDEEAEYWDNVGRMEECRDS